MAIAKVRSDFLGQCPAKKYPSPEKRTISNQSQVEVIGSNLGTTKEPQSLIDTQSRHVSKVLQFEVQAALLSMCKLWRWRSVVSTSIVPSGNFAELIRTVTCMVLKANDRRTSSPLPR
ncbi:hypothetical protein TNCV_5030761 [Trichonephila clavipes]|nr:hypothetical protein TNCV_5030761 [Trichonephila clavipes]